MSSVDAKLASDTLASDYLALTEEVGVVVGERDVVKVSGSEACSYLDGQLSQAISSLETSSSGWSFILQPTGKVDAYCRVFRTVEEEFYLEVPAGCGEAVLSRLQRFKLRVKCEIELQEWQSWEVRGPQSATIDTAEIEHNLHADVVWENAIGFDLLGATLPAVAPPLRECSKVALDALRIEAGIPIMGQDILEGSIPGEVGSLILNDAVSFTKGCYVGQELVARVESRGGNVPRRLMGVMLEGAAGLAARATLADSDGRQVGTLTSFAQSPRLGSIGIATLHRSVDIAANLTCGTATARIVALPFSESIVQKGGE